MNELEILKNAYSLLLKKIENLIDEEKTKNPVGVDFTLVPFSHPGFIKGKYLNVILIFDKLNISDSFSKEIEAEKSLKKSLPVEYFQSQKQQLRQSQNNFEVDEKSLPR